MQASDLLVPSPFGRSFLRLPPWFQEALRDHGFGPHQSDGHVLMLACGWWYPGDWWPTHFGRSWWQTHLDRFVRTYPQLSPHTHGGRGSRLRRSHGGTWADGQPSECGPPGDRTPLLTLNVNYDGRFRTGRSGPRVLPPLLWLTCNWSSGGIGSPPGSRRWALWIRKCLGTTSVGSGRKDFSPILYRMPQASHT